MGDGAKPKIQADPWREYDAAALLALSGDISILLSDEFQIRDVVVPEKDKFEIDLRKKWLGLFFGEIVASDSIAKTESLLGSDACSSKNGARWRHLNLLAEDAPDVPVLAKYFVVRTAFGDVRQVICRDLRPMTELHALWQRDRRKLNEHLERTSAANTSSLPVDELVGAAPLADIIAAAADEVARMCIEEALRSNAGDEAAAAELLSISVGELRRRSRKNLH